MPGRRTRRSAAEAPAYRRAWATAVAKTLSHPLRLEILRQVREADTASPSAIATDVSRNLSLVAYHVRQLRSAGLLKTAGTRPVRGALEHLYELTDVGSAALNAADGVLRLDPAVQSPRRRRPTQ